MRDDNSTFLDGENEIPKKPGIYLFAVNDRIHYVGKADKQLYKRVRRYKTRMLGDEDEFRPVHKGIRNALKSGGEVTVFTLDVEEPRVIKFEGMPLDRLVGIEAGLIETLNPDWNPYNSTGRRRRTIDV